MILFILFSFCVVINSQQLNADVFKVISNFEVPSDYDDVLSEVDCKYWIYFNKFEFE